MSIASSWLVADDVAQGRLLHLAPQWHAAPLPVYIVYPYSRLYPAKLRRFTELLRAALPVGMAWPGVMRPALP